MEKTRVNPYDDALKQGLFGVALSGGGIRSATFNLGVLQGLAEGGLLSQIDYLSTVSGGGYIGGWLTAWIQRASLPVVETNIKTSTNPKSDEGRPIAFLREYSQYLAPQPGMFAPDSWTMLAVFLRNLILNQTVILLALAAILTIPLLPIVLVQVARQHMEVSLAMIAGATALPIHACWLIRDAVVTRGKGEVWGRQDVVQKIVLRILLSCVLYAIGTWGIQNTRILWGRDIARNLYSAPYLFLGTLLALSFPHFARDWKLGYQFNQRIREHEGLGLDTRLRS